jgi:hypothetical protein
VAAGVPRITDPKMWAVRCLAASADGSIWFTNAIPGAFGSIGCLDTNGLISWYDNPSGIPDPSAITIGPDGRPWFVYDGGIGCVRADGTVLKVYENGEIGPYAYSITATPDAVWFSVHDDVAGGETSAQRRRLPLLWREPFGEGKELLLFRFGELLHQGQPVDFGIVDHGAATAIIAPFLGTRPASLRAVP